LLLCSSAPLLLASSVCRALDGLQHGAGQQLHLVAGQRQRRDAEWPNGPARLRGAPRRARAGLRPEGGGECRPKKALQRLQSKPGIS
jgi:hypothetical protein